MKKASLILIIAGAVFGLLFSVPGIFLGARSLILGTAGGAVLFGGSIAITALSVIAIVARVYPERVPFASWIIPLFACLSGFVLLGFLWLPPGMLLLAGAAFSLIAERENA